MLSVLVEGVLVCAPVRRTGARGGAFVTAQVRCNAEDGESLLVSVIAFSASATEALARLGAGDTVAIAGPAAIGRWEKNGEPHVGLKVTATRVMTVYDAGLRRKAASQGPQEREPQDGGQAGQRPGRNPPGHRRELPARQRPARFDDDGGPV